MRGGQFWCGRGGCHRGGPVIVTTKSMAQDMGMGERGDRLEGGGDGESMAIKEDGCTVGTRSRALGLEAQTDFLGGAGGWEEVGMGA